MSRFRARRGTFFCRIAGRPWSLGEISLRVRRVGGGKSSPPIRSFGLASAKPGETFYVTDEAELTTWAAEVRPDGSLGGFRIFAQQGGDGVAVDARGNVYIAAGQVYVFDATGKPLEKIEVPERPIQLVFGGVDGRTLVIAARSSLYSVRTRFPGRDRVP